jgi:predicted DNA binding CopG/RHH family protein
MEELNDYEELGDIELSEEEGEHYNKMINLAEEQIEDVRVSFRWKSKQLNIIKQASQLIGIPYQTYIKTVLFNQSIEDIRKAKSVL